MLHKLKNKTKLHGTAEFNMKSQENQPRNV